MKDNEQISKTVDVNSVTPISTLNVNKQVLQLEGINLRDRLEITQIYALYNRDILNIKTFTLNVKLWKMSIDHGNTNHKKAGVAIFSISK